MKLINITKKLVLMIFLLELLAMVGMTQPVSQAAVTPATNKAPRIEVAFVLDTTGSMGGLIAGAKAKIWSIANQIVSAKPTPQLKIGLIAYRDRGDAYVTKLYDLSADIDTVYAHLQEFQAGGGGDTPESVNQALNEAVTRLGWSTDRNVLKIVFLVGDCPPHMDYKEDVKYPQTCQLAVKNDLIINTVQCGSDSSTTPIWQEIASLAEGNYVAIGQTGDIQVIATPMDKELAELNVAVGRTLVPYGRKEEQERVMAKQAKAEMAAPAASADRMAYNSATGGVAVQGGGDLVDDVQKGRVQLKEVADEKLPAEMQKQNLEQRQAYLKAKAEARQQLQVKINQLLRQRQDYINAETRRLEKEGKGSSFDREVSETLRSQAKRKGITYAEGSK